MSRSLKNYFFVGLKGMAMGAADVVPGVSGGTIAFISGIYEELLNAISNININALKTLKKQGFKAAWQQINGNFLLALFIGIFCSIISLAKAIKWLLATHPVLLWAFFFGLVLASVLYVAKQINKWNFKVVLVILLGAIAGYAITIFPPLVSEEVNYLFLLLAGAIAACAMILPGISGAYILLLLGAYSTVMEAIANKDLKIIASIGMGAVLGLIVFSKGLKWLFSHYKNYTLAALTGIMMGSLNKIWPWKLTVSTYINSHGKEKALLEQSISPFSYDGDAQLLFTIGLALIGFGLIFLMERIAIKK